ncbi:MAG: hypothetical protein HY820_22285 [Acidobacteria bacterium]|nr:hypothetical protein [Acidobacteriota bacterium]
MKPKQLRIPSFRNEREEAAWWDKHREEVEAGLRHAIRSGKTTSLREVLAPQKPVKLQPVTLRLPTEDIATARQLAGMKGLGYQTYIKLILREALKKETLKKEASIRK